VFDERQIQRIYWNDKHVSRDPRMKKRNMQIAQQYGEKLPAFDNPQEAEEYFRDFRKQHLALLEEAAGSQTSFAPDFSPESLKPLEEWYFYLHDKDAFRHIPIKREILESCMAVYFGETAVRNSDTEWTVSGYYLAPNRYHLGVKKKHFTMTLMRFTDYYKEPNNKRREGLFRRYRKYFAEK
jgi:hypothetical protein